MPERVPSPFMLEVPDMPEDEPDGLALPLVPLLEVEPLFIIELPVLPVVPIAPMFPVLPDSLFILLPAELLLPAGVVLSRWGLPWQGWRHASCCQIWHLRCPSCQNLGRGPSRQRRQHLWRRADGPGDGVGCSCAVPQGVAD